MPARLLVSIEPKVLHERGVWADTGPALHAHVLAAVSVVEPELGASLHQPAKGGQPFAISPVLRRDGTPSQWRFEVGVLDDTLIDPFADGLEHAELVRLGHSSFVVTGVRAVATSYEQVLDAGQPATRWGFQLVTPLTCRTTGASGAQRCLPLPDAQLVFSRLRRRFERYAPKGLLPAEVETVIDEHLAVASFELTAARYLVKAPATRNIGAVGSVTYVIVRPDQLSAASLRGVDALVRFAAFAGAGDQTTKGMGVVVPFDPS